MPQENKDYDNKLLHLLLEMGEKLLNSGAEIKRVEDTMERLGMAYGAKRMNAFVITTSIILTLEHENGTLVTQARRLTGQSVTDFCVLEKLNALSRKCCEEHIPLEEFERQMEKCVPPDRKWDLYLGSALTAGTFALFFGGSLWDGITASIFALFICFLKGRYTSLFYSNIMFNLSCSFIVGLLICMTAKCLPTLHVDKIIIGDIMLLIPGLAMTNAVRDMLVGDTISGMMRLTESILWAGALAVGFMASMWVMGL